MKLIVGALSTWSMRAWLCLKIAELPCEEVVLSLSTPNYRERLAKHSPSGLVPVLDTGAGLVHDSLAIAEYANELSGGKLLPTNPMQRAQCRSLCAELHSGFTRIRTQLPFQWNPSPLNQRPAELASELQRLETVWAQAQGDFYFDSATMVDAFYAVMALRLQRYGQGLSGAAGDYQNALLDWPLFREVEATAQQWRSQA